MVKQMTSIVRARALGNLQVGWNITQVAEKFGRHKSVISRLAKKAREMGEVIKWPGCVGCQWGAYQVLGGSGKYPRGVRKVPSPWQELKILYQPENK